MSTPQGVVYLVGAGPGDPGLITLTGWRLLANADCVVYDKLVDHRLIERAPAHAERIYVGKEPGSNTHCTPQAAINQILIDKARSGKRVVRLKGGDALLFARGAEEAEALRGQGIRYEIIPGVTAALAAAATAAIPLTFRHVASAVAVVTGHEDPSKSSALDWDVLARFPGTIVIYMALRRFGVLAKELIEHGKNPQTPIALVEWGGTNRQRTATMTLEQAVAGPPTEFRSPALAIVGPVCDLRAKLAWFEDRPLFGQRVLVMRAAHQTIDVFERLEALGAQVVGQPVFRIEPPSSWIDVDQSLYRLPEFDWLVFSSRNGVSMFLNRLLAIGKDVRALGSLQIAAIGPGTADELTRFQLRADLVPEQFRSESLADALAGIARGKRILWPRANRGRDVLLARLGQAGTAVETVVVYRQVDVTEPEPNILQELRDGRIGWVMLSSSNMARGFFRWLDAELAGIVRRCVRLVSISPVTSEVIRSAGFGVAAEATTFTPDGMIDAVVRALQLAPGFETKPDD
jgi:uroporphyrinogen III methyltransferase/synthase